MIKRILAILLSAVMILSIAACNKDPDPTPIEEDENEAAEAAVITRAQWIQRLTDVMGYNKENDAEPYFTDVQPGASAYDSVQIAVAYNLLDPDTERFAPGDPATRAFVLSTTAKAIGFTETPDHDFFFGDTDGRYNPGESVTVTESEDILRKVRDAISITIDPNHVDVVVLNENVTDLSETVNAVTYNDPYAFSVTLTEDAAAGLEVGSVCILPPTGEYPYGVARKVTAITPDGAGGFIVESDEPEIDELFSEVDVQGVYTPDFSNMQWADGVTGEIVSNGNTGLSAQQGGFAVRPLNNNIPFLGDASAEMKIVVGEKVSLDIVFHEFLVSYEMLKFFGFPLSTSVFIEESHTLTIGVMDSISEDISIGFFSIPLGLTGFEIRIYLSISASGQLVFSFEHYTKTKTAVHSGLFGLFPSVSSRALESELKFTNVMGQVEAGIKLGAALRFFGVEIIDLYVFAGAAAKASMSSKGCIDAATYMPLYVKFTLFPCIKKTLDLSVTVHIFDERNSPLRNSLHIEDGVLVALCEVEYITIRGERYHMSLTELNLSHLYYNLTEEQRSLSPEELISILNAEIIPLMHMTDLETLKLGDYFNYSSSRISDISVLSGLTNLTILDLGGSYNYNGGYGISDISALSGLTNLTELYLNNNQTSDISALSGLTNLTRLFLEINQISDINALSGLTNLTRLSLGGNQISDISVLSGLTNLTELYLSGESIDYAQLVELKAALPNCRVEFGSTNVG